MRAVLLAAAAWLASGSPAAAQERPSSSSSTPAGLSAENARTQTALSRPAGWELVWADEFDRGTAPDPAKWRYDTVANKTGWYNNEKQYYAADRRENARIEDGRLILEARRERLSDRADYGGQDYSSARLLTQDTRTWTYGFFEVRAKLACGRGIWPAIWMLGNGKSVAWPARGEIDIMEHVGHEPGQVHGTIHTKAYNHAIGTQKGAATTVPDACDAFHDYQLLWTREAIVIGVDGKATMRFANDHAGDSATWPFDDPEYLILNVAVGGDWGGAKGIDPAALPARMEVEYVRVYQPPR